MSLACATKLLKLSLKVEEENWAWAYQGADGAGLPLQEEASEVELKVKEKTWAWAYQGADGAGFPLQEEAGEVELKV